MKNIKKISLITLLSAGMIITTACSQTANQTAENKTEQKENVKLSNEEILNKAIEAFKNLNSYETNYEEQLILGSNENGQSLTREKTEIFSATKEPLATKYQMKSADNFAGNIVGNIVTEGYLFEGVEYNNLDGSGRWTKTTSTPEQLEKSKTNIFSEPGLESILKHGKDYTITEDGTSYIIEFKPADLEEFSKKYSNEKVTRKYDKFFNKFIIDKKTFLVSQFEGDVEFIYTVTENGQSTRNAITSKTTYSNFNSVPAITLPEEAKNATAQ